jgi:hypothetical protein
VIGEASRPGRYDVPEIRADLFLSAAQDGAPLESRHPTTRMEGSSSTWNPRRIGRLPRLTVGAIPLPGSGVMKKLSLRPLPDRIAISLYDSRGGDKANEGWFFLSPAEWEKFKVNLANSCETIRAVQSERWHDIDVFSSDDFDATIRDLRSQRYLGGCMMEPL